MIALIMMICGGGLFVFLAVDILRISLGKPKFHRHRWLVGFDVYLYEECVVCHKVRYIPDPQK